MPSVCCRLTDTHQMQKVRCDTSIPQFELHNLVIGSTLASAFKRVLLSNDETLQLSGVQCVSEVLTHQPQYGETLLKADIAGQNDQFLPLHH